MQGGLDKVGLAPVIDKSSLGLMLILHYWVDLVFANVMHKYSIEFGEKKEKNEKSTTYVEHEKLGQG